MKGYFANRLANWSFWLTGLLFALLCLLFAYAYLPSLSLSKQALDSYEAAPYGYTLHSQVSEVGASNEFVYFDSGHYLYTVKQDDGYYRGISNTFVLMEEPMTAYFPSALKEGKDHLASDEVGVTAHLADRYHLAIGDPLYFPDGGEQTLTLAAIYEDSYGFFSVQLVGDYGYLRLGYEAKRLNLEHTYLRFVEDYPTGILGPVSYNKAAFVDDLQASLKRTLSLFAFGLSVSALASFALLNLSRLLRQLPSYRLYGFRTRDLMLEVGSEESCQFVLAYLAFLVPYFLGAYSSYGLLVGSVVMAAIYLLSFGISSLVLCARRSPYGHRKI